MRKALLVACSLGCAPQEATFAVRWTGLDTLDAELVPTALRCPRDGTVLVEGVGDSIGVLLSLPAESAAAYPIDSGGAAIVVSRVRPGRIETGRGDSGQVTLTTGVGGDLLGSYHARLPDARVEGDFGPLRVTADAGTCPVRDSLSLP